MIKLKDKDDNEFILYDEIWEHIRRFHPEITQIEVLQSVLQYPDAIIKSSWDPESVLYYKRSRHLYKVVVVQLKEKRIKTTLTERKIKKGEILWINPRLLS
ncbi:MAG: hypothetical protein QME81_04760 [bacterium]|nr:hypothetical protein [bacterium]